MATGSVKKSPAPKRTAPKKTTPAKATPAKKTPSRTASSGTRSSGSASSASGTRSQSGASRSGNAGSTGSVNQSSKSTSASGSSQDRFQSSGERAESVSGNVNNLVKGLGDWFNGNSADTAKVEPASAQQQPEKPQDPRAKFFKDEKHLEKLSTAKEELQQARDGTHEKLQEIESRQQSERSEAISSEKAEAEKAQTKLDDAERQLGEAEANIERRSQEAPQQREEARQEGLRLAEEMREIDSPNGRGNLLNDLKVTQNNIETGEKSLGHLERMAEQAQNPTVKRQANEAIARKKKEIATAKKQLQDMQSNPEYGDKVKSFLDAKKTFNDNAPERVEALNGAERAQAQGRARQAKQDFERASSQLKEAEKQYDAKHGAANSAELQEAKDKLTSDLGARVEDLSTIKREDLADGITQASAFGGGVGDFKAELTDDGLKINNNGRDVQAKPTEDGGWNVSSERQTDHQGYQSRESQMVQDADGKWREARTESKTWSTRQDKQAGRDPRSSETTQRFEDGSSLSEFESRHKGSHGISDYTTTGRRVVGANGETSSQSVSKYDDGTVSQTVSRSSPDGSRFNETTYTSAEGDYQNTKSVTVDKDGKIREVERNYRETDYGDPGVHGVGWFPGNSPEDLRSALGPNPKHAEITTSVKERDSKYGPTTYSGSKSHRWSSQDGNKTLDYEKGQNGMPDTYKFTRVDGDEVHSQTFTPGSNDTTISHTRTDENGFRVTETQEDHREFAQAVKEQTGKDVPVGGESVTREKEEAKAEDLRKILADTHGFQGMENSDAVKEFMQHMGDGTFNLASNEMFTSNDASGQPEGEMFDTFKNAFEGNSQVLAMAPDGSRLVMRYDSESGQRVAQFVKPGEEGGEDYHALSMGGEDGKRLEVNSNGEAFRVDPGAAAGGIRTAIKDVDLVGGLATRGTRYAAEGGLTAAKFARNLSRLGHTTDTTDALKGLKALDSGYFGSLAGGFDGANTMLSLTQSYSDSINGDYNAAYRHAAQAANDLGGFAGLAKAGGQLTTVGKLGSYLGVAGAVANAGFAAYDFYNGDYLRGGLGVAGAVGSGMGIAGGIWAGTSWMGPVGWGIATAATIGTLTYDYIDSTSIARTAPGILN